jgi:hypothetical protein
VNRGVTPVKVETVGHGSSEERSSEERSGGTRLSRGERNTDRAMGTRKGTAWALFTGPRRGF